MPEPQRHRVLGLAHRIRIDIRVLVGILQRRIARLPGPERPAQQGRHVHAGSLAAYIGQRDIDTRCNPRAEHPQPLHQRRRRQRIRPRQPVANGAQMHQVGIVAGVRDIAPAGQPVIGIDPHQHPGAMRLQPLRIAILRAQGMPQQRKADLADFHDAPPSRRRPQQRKLAPLRSTVRTRPLNSASPYSGVPRRRRIRSPAL